MAHSGQKSLCLDMGAAGTLQDASVTLPVPSGIIGFQFWFAFSRATAPASAELLISLEKRKALADNQLQEMWFSYLMDTGVARIRDNNGITNLRTFSPVLAPCTDVAGNFGVPDTSVSATDHGNPWHYIKTVADVKNGIWKTWIIDDVDMSSLLPTGSSHWYEPVGHFISSAGVYRCEIHNISGGSGPSIIWIDDVVITDEG